MNDNYELKPCPFCGFKAEIKTATFLFCKSYNVLCLRCESDAGLYVDEKQVAVDRWNCRPKEEE